MRLFGLIDCIASYCLQEDGGLAQPGQVIITSGDVILALFFVILR